jgi:hypothetical protein
VNDAGFVSSDKRENVAGRHDSLSLRRCFLNHNQLGER